MATRSTIAVELTDGRVRSIYCHWDGYIEYNGKLLSEFYNTQELAELVTSAGDMSSLNKKFEPLTDYHSFDNPEEDVCVLYGRDRGEIGTATKYYSSYDDYINQLKHEEFNYIYRNDKWYVDSDERGFRELADYLVEQPAV